ncbi:exonuclease domain-containing protein [Malacoplasma iowae]|uniref:EXOIII domain protein n=2 Tax=Malacoplasma iowae TaxID=2116 RepID=A0A084U3G3_MALIO|nr:exonuclease domain-containing protein [Malacoplasma iowae]VEU62237.1 DNA polymerase III polC-type [Mycoplasmopsis fermentans]EGZ31655.1 DNA polymerase III [Malacoplasma iowae 695]KFB07499.1 EXOIII domain protein [Malacoplasma iowae DK-CPA]QHG89902.1 exonuclease domain-containing protein [Malacoplasma iowae 695]WPL35287.1 exonuclease domain-containing protein [Malacoplasma iowae]
MFSYPKDKDLVFVDIEANMKPKRLVQFGAIKVKQDQSIEEYNIFSNPKCKLTERIKSMLANNLENIKNAQDNIRSLKDIYNILDGCILVSYGSFDYDFLNFLSKKLLKKKLNVTFIDLQEEWKKISYSKNPISLTGLARLLGVEYEENKLHDGLYDARILYNIFFKWKEMPKSDIWNIIFKYKLSYVTETSLKQNKSNQSSKTIDNKININGFVFLNINFKKIKKSPDFINERMLSGLSLIEIQNNTLKRNWDFFYDYDNRFFDYDDYIEKLGSVLKQYIISTRNKKIIINDNKYHELIRLHNLCSKYIKVYPICKLSYSSGFEHLFNKINFDEYKYSQNLDLIKNWLVYRYLENN